MGRGRTKGNKLRQMLKNTNNYCPLRAKRLLESQKVALKERMDGNPANDPTYHKKKPVSHCLDDMRLNKKAMADLVAKQKKRDKEQREKGEKAKTKAIKTKPTKKAPKLQNKSISKASNESRFKLGKCLTTVAIAAVAVTGAVTGAEAASLDIASEMDLSWDYQFYQLSFYLTSDIHGDASQLVFDETIPSTSIYSNYTLKCTNCGTSIDCHCARAFGNVMLPRRCENSNNPNNDNPCPVDPFIILPDKSDFLDIQKLKLQETPEDIPTGEMPRHIWLFTERKLVNRVKPGSRVKIVGIYKIYDTKVSGARKSDRYDISVRKPYIEVVGIEEENADDKRGLWLPEMEETINDLARSSKNGIYKDIAESIAPAIWRNEDIKKAIACLLFGCSSKHLNDGMHLRGDINVLLLGDPSVAKSQFLKFVNQIAPVSVYTSGKGSSAPGLTASVLKDSSTGEFHLEGGAMVLADGGVVCIDEFDKMRESDRVAIHEAMEQQTISIAKAGITTILNSHISVLAAANPVFGRYDDLRSTNENIDLETTILSRFDSIFIIRDTKDVDSDTRLANHIMNLHINIAGSSHDDSPGGAGAGSGRRGGRNNNNSNNNNMVDDSSANAAISPEMLSKYISYARHRIHPRLKNHYVEFRRSAKEREMETDEQSAIPLTVRQLESLAKMELSNSANEDHVKEAVRLFKVSTLKSAQGAPFGGEGSLGSSQLRENIQKAERNVARRLPIESSMSVSKLVQEMALVGAMVLADGGVVCIDEFDKMRAPNCVAIHEAIEQQTLSIAKAGITTIQK